MVTCLTKKPLLAAKLLSSFAGARVCGQNRMRKCFPVFRLGPSYSAPFSMVTGYFGIHDWFLWQEDLFVKGCLAMLKPEQFILSLRPGTVQLWPGALAMGGIVPRPLG